jgi:uncharacterized membrane protein YccC
MPSQSLSGASGQRAAPQASQDKPFADFCRNITLWQHILGTTTLTGTSAALSQKQQLCNAFDRLIVDNSRAPNAYPLQGSLFEVAVVTHQYLQST